ncbi:hypothetical protein BaRGS_00007755, partial [Batillaria attramentaria]
RPGPSATVTCPFQHLLSPARGASVWKSSEASAIRNAQGACSHNARAHAPTLTPLARFQHPPPSLPA